MEQSWNGNGMSGTDAWNRAGTEMGCLEQMHGTELERNWDVWNRYMEQSWNVNGMSGTDAWNRYGTEIRWNIPVLVKGMNIIATDVFKE